MIIFSITAIVLVISALGVVLFRSPLHCALSLFAHLLGVAAVYAALHAHFLAVVQVIVYAGAVVVLVLFVIMLLNLQSEVRQQISKSLLAGGSLAAVLFMAAVIPLFGDPFPGDSGGAGISVEGTVRNVGLLLFSQYFFLFQAAGILLLAATVGAVMIARKPGSFKPGETEQ